MAIFYISLSKKFAEESKYNFRQVFPFNKILKNRYWNLTFSLRSEVLNSDLKGKRITALKTCNDNRFGLYLEAVNIIDR